MLDPFDTLGLSPAFDIDERHVEQRYRDLSRVLHPDRHVGKSPAERRIALGKAVEVNEAIRVVRDPIERATALLSRLRGSRDHAAEPKADPALLLQMMEAREALAEAKAVRDPARIRELAAAIEHKRQTALSELSRAFLSPDPERTVLPLLGELRYYRRFLDEVGAIEDDLLGASAPSGAPRA